MVCQMSVNDIQITTVDTSATKHKGRQNGTLHISEWSRLSETIRGREDEYVFEQ